MLDVCVMQSGVDVCVMQSGVEWCDAVWCLCDVSGVWW